MSVATIVRANAAFVEVSVPYDVANLLHHVYVAHSPLERFAKKLTVGPPVEAPVGEFRFFWNHAEFGFPDEGGRYHVRVTDETAGGENELERAKILSIPPPTRVEPIPLVLSRTNLVDDITLPGAISDYFVSVRDFEKARIRLDVAVPTGFLEVLVETAMLRAGPWEALPAPSVPAAGVVTLDKGLFRVPAGSAPSELVVAVPEANFLRLRVREDALNDKVVNEIDIERLKTRVEA